ncbi:TPA: hypothetical protein N2952_002093 [Vibrio parahaemolyticus]|uniref:Uncharacterized protein n=1 Tax=Vibrio parahaemolyticus TaxID=670 RepID=A0A227JII4_VIBPH|nr:hypothetical protein [Vibrio parahaemolyticus]EGR0405551.1 hypothetical protein [Vibrio parahaemolyticus]ELJ8803489.1 hypothetical protein [Vibrio parahaemolyticus]OXE34889.1 hypothetical protein CA163_00065 [Vibrio parahaemolyticus]HAS6844380.1 hypothetical protein [Vibrio parahaemolyticus]HBB9985522.1 hypothetical protein [Vibrio parahaemolyticus]
MNFYECELQTNDITAIKLVLECLRVKKNGCKKETREVFNRLKNKVKTKQTIIKTAFVVDEDNTVKCCGLFESMAEYPNFICMKSFYFTRDFSEEVELSTALDLFYDVLDSDGSKLMLKVNDRILNGNYQNFLNAGFNKILLTENQNYILKDKDVIDLLGTPTVKYVADLSHFVSKESFIKTQFHSYLEHLELDQEVAWLVANLKSIIDGAKIKSGNENIVEEWQKIVAWLDVEDDTILSKDEITECFAELRKDFTILSKKEEATDEINEIFRLIEELQKIALMVIAHSEIEMEEAA